MTWFHSTVVFTGSSQIEPGHTCCSTPGKSESTTANVRVTTILHKNMTDNSSSEDDDEMGEPEANGNSVVT